MRLLNIFLCEDLLCSLDMRVSHLRIYNIFENACKAQAI